MFELVSVQFDRGNESVTRVGIRIGESEKYLDISSEWSSVSVSSLVVSIPQESIKSIKILGMLNGNGFIE